jgi:bidirectional [NiFe] hydrogenase diaphorase subunit
VVCLGTACYVKGANALLDTLKAEIDIKPGETTADGQVSLVIARCIGACGIAPAVVFDGKVVGKQTEESVMENIQPWVTGE